MTKDQIREIALQCGFDLEEQYGGAMDLPNHVYKFAEKIYKEALIQEGAKYACEAINNVLDKLNIKK